MPRVQSRLSQKTQFTWVTHLFLKLALDVDIVVLLKKMDELSRSVRPSQPIHGDNNNRESRAPELLAVRSVCDNNDRLAVNFKG